MPPRYTTPISVRTFGSVSSLLIPPTVNIDVRRPREEPYHDIPEHQRDRLSRYGGGGGERVRPYVPFDIGTLH
jgi:hypothetical protein